MIRRLASVAAAALLLAACAGLPEPDAQVVLFEMGFDLPDQLPAGEVVLAVDNIGWAHHNLTICKGELGECEEEPIAMDVLAKPDDARDPDAIPDRTSSFVIGAKWEALVRTDALEPGRYRLYCAILGHTERGMEAVVDVG